MIFFAVLASGDALHWRGLTLPIHMPDIVLSKLPFFANVRTPARAIVFAYLFLGIGAAAAMAAALKSGRRLMTGAALTLVVALMLLDFFPAHLSTTAMRCAPELAVLAKDRDRNFGVLDLPFGYSEADFYMAQQACHGRPIVQGVIARQLAPTLADHLEVGDLAAQRRQLQAAGIKYILLHHPRDGMFSWDTPSDGDQARYRQTYPLAADGTDMAIFKVY